jgi:1,4-alpha-glucan branching enzyme
MPGDRWQRFANLRAYYAFMWTHPGKKLLFMGGEFGQWHEWDHDRSLDWHLLELPLHQGVQRWIHDLNRVYRGERALHGQDFAAEGFRWIDQGNAALSVISFLRQAPGGEPVVVACNFTPVPRHNYRVGVPRGGRWQELLNSDALHYGGSGQGNLGGLDAAPVSAGGYFHSVNATLPPLGIVALKAI